MEDDGSELKKGNAVLSWKERREARRRKRMEEEAEERKGKDEEKEEEDFEALMASNDRHRRRGGRSHDSDQKKEDTTSTMTWEEEEDTSSLYRPHVSAAKRLRLERNEILGAAASASVGADTMTTEHDKNSEQNSNTEEGQTKKQEDDREMEERAAAAEAQSLLAKATLLKKSRDENMTLLEKQEEERQKEETRILKEASKVQTNALQAASELAQGVVYTSSLPTSWTCPSAIVAEGEASWQQMRGKYNILVEGTDCPPPLRSFADMKFPRAILETLEKRNIRKPTPIQMQGIPVALAGRDMVGIAFTGSGKTVTFTLPLIMAALEEELRQPLVGGEGPIGIIMAPSRELVRQTYEQVVSFCDALSGGGNDDDDDDKKENGFPKLRTQLVIGGESGADQLQVLRREGVHCVVATPGRLRDFLKRRSMNLDNCRYICLDEADRMLDLGFDEEVGDIMNFFTHQRQTLLFSATFPKKFQDFAKSTLIQPVVVNVGRAGAANLDVIQEVEYVKQEAKIVYLLECLQKTAPPVIIFCEKKGDVDDIHEYLLLKGVDAVSIHGGKDQAERNESIDRYKRGEVDVLVATDVAAKGLDFPHIRHVINFDMPAEIENYVHRIGRTGRCGKTGVATTFINKSCEETTLLDLKHLLKEARQRIPPVLLIMDDPLEQAQAQQGGVIGCSFCGGLGHTIVDCPKIDKDARRVAGGRKDALASGDGYGGEI